MVIIEIFGINLSFVYNKTMNGPAQTIDKKLKNSNVSLGVVENILKSSYYSLFEILILTVLIFLLFYVDKSLFKLRIFAYIFGVAYIFLISKLTSINKVSLGLTNKHFRDSIKWLFLPTLVSIAGIIALRYFFPTLFSFDILSWTIDLSGFGRMLVYGLISAPLQEIIFRSYLISRMENVFKNKLTIIFLSSLIFSAVHIPFGSLFMIIGTFLLGILLSYNFIKFRNVSSCILSHAIIGGTLVYFLIS